MPNAEHIATFKSVKEAKQIVYAEVYAPSRMDADNEFMRADHIEKMAHNFLRAMKLDAVDHQHDQENKEGCCVVESFIARKGDPDFIEGAWVVGVHIDNADLWGKVLKGEINGFSMEAMVHKHIGDVEMEVPPVLSGKTLKSEDSDHTHEYHVAYSPDGTFLGGKTSEEDGHYHVIKRGTATETSAGHNHRFAHMEQILIA